MFNMKTVSVRMYTFYNCENYVKVSHDCPTKRDGSSFKTFVMQQSSRNIKFAKIYLCPPPFVSRILLSWQLVDPYRYESNSHSNDMPYKFAVNVKEHQDKRPTMYWLPKLHKRPYKTRVIANSSSCTTTELSK